MGVGAMMAGRATYEETFDHGSGGWCTWRRHGVNERLDVANGVATIRSPWGVDSNHAPPGAGYLTLLGILYTVPELAPIFSFGSPNPFVDGGYSRDLTNARMTLRMRGDARLRGSEVTLLIQSDVPGARAAFILTGQSFRVTPDWSEQSVTLAPDRSDWTSVGARHDLKHRYGHGDVVEALRDVNYDLIIVLYPLLVVPPPELADDVHRLRPEIDYEPDRRYLPEGEIQIDTVRIEYPPI
jgi:hypothetical protein